ncbi:MAG: hypothetical protein KIT22_13040, partial [Verrucomicrobiae bacterium]|nr:hypothetical protein [Verrucomicrobiae bacterium]
MKRPFSWPAAFAFALACFLTLIAPRALQAAEPGVRITDQANRTLPIAITGFSDEVRKILEFDLYVVGFDVNPANPQYLLKSTPGGSVQATLS